MEANKTIMHFHYEFPLPENSTMRPYTPAPVTNSKKKNKHKLTKFTYYRSADKVEKVLFLDDEHYINQGSYPFTDPQGKIHNFEELGKVERVILTEAVYVGHIVTEGSINLAIKKVNEAKINLASSEIETNDDNFELIPVGNEERFNQFLKILKFNPNAPHMSIRVIIEDVCEGGPKVIDYQFFEREAQIKKSKAYAGKVEQRKEK